MHDERTKTPLAPRVFFVFAAALASCQFASADEPARTAAADLEHGRKLYEMSCDACHSANVHWRDKRLANSWPALLQQVERWRRNTGLRWEPADVNDVAAYLNQRFYHLDCPANECDAKAAALEPKREPR